MLIFPDTDFHFPSTSVPPDTFLGSVVNTTARRCDLVSDYFDHSFTCATQIAMSFGDGQSYVGS